MHHQTILKIVCTGYNFIFLTFEMCINGRTIKAVYMLHTIHIFIIGIVLKGEVSKFSTLSIIIMFV